MRCQRPRIFACGKIGGVGEARRIPFPWRDMKPCAQFESKPCPFIPPEKNYINTGSYLHAEKIDSLASDLLYTRARQGETRH